MKYIIKIWLIVIAHNYLKMNDKEFLVSLFTIFLDYIYDAVENIINYIFG